MWVKQNRLSHQVFVQINVGYLFHPHLLKQTIRNQLIEDEYNKDNLFIIDGIVSTRRANERHWQLVREIMRLPCSKSC